MSDFGPLFDDGWPPEDSGPDAPLSGVAPSAGDADTLTVLELNHQIDLALRGAFPQEVWVRGEVSGLDRARGRGGRNLYFELVQKEQHSDHAAAKLSVVLLYRNRAGIQRQLRSVPDFRLDDGVEVRFRGRVNFFVPFGKLQLELTEVDPAFTMGQIEANRRRVLEALQREGLLDLQKQLSRPVVPLHVGLVTSVGSAAYNDFVEELESGGFAHRITAVDARVQGWETEHSVVAGLRTLARRQVDIIVLIRGGGSRSDLAWMDNEAIARTIACSPVPVLTGIGHEIDESVADKVAYAAFKTPTACAAAVVEWTAAFVDRVEAAWERLAEGALEWTEAEAAELVLRAQRSGRSASALLRRGEENLSQSRRGLTREARRGLQGRERALEARGGEVRAAARLRVTERAGALERARRALRRDRLVGICLRQARELQRAQVVLLRRWPARAGLEGERLAAWSSRLRSLDPARVLARGYSLTRLPDGRLIRSIRDVTPPAGIVTTLADGQLTSRVESVHVRGDDGDGGEE